MISHAVLCVFVTCKHRLFCEMNHDLMNLQGKLAYKIKRITHYRSQYICVEHVAILKIYFLRNYKGNA